MFLDTSLSRMMMSRNQTPIFYNNSKMRNQCTLLDIRRYFLILDKYHFIIFQHLVQFFNREYLQTMHSASQMEYFDLYTSTKHDRCNLYHEYMHNFHLSRSPLVLIEGMVYGRDMNLCKFCLQNTYILKNGMQFNFKNFNIAYIYTCRI